MTEAVVVRSRQAGTVERRTTDGPSDALIQKAKMLAASPDMLPKHYANKPGACMMLLDWTDRNDVSIFEGIAEVAIVHGKPVVSAKMQKRMAARVGYRAKKVEGTAEEVTVAVYGPDGEETGRSTYTIEMAEGYGLLAKSAKSARNGGTDFWSVDPEWMLTKRATTRALEEHGPDELASIFADDDDLPDAGDDLPADDEPVDESDPADGIDLVEDRIDALKSLAKQQKVTQASLLGGTKNATGEHHPTLRSLASNPDHTQIMLDWLETQ